MSNTIRTHDEIQLLAYQFWQGRGCPLGTPEVDWFRAEQEHALPNNELTQVAREIGALVGSAVALLTSR